MTDASKCCYGGPVANCGKADCSYRAARVKAAAEERIAADAAQAIAALIRKTIVGELLKAAAALADCADPLLIGLLVKRAAIVSRGESDFVSVTDDDLAMVNDMERKFDEGVVKEYGREPERTPLWPYTNNACPED